MTGHKNNTSTRVIVNLHVGVVFSCISCWGRWQYFKIGGSSYRSANCDDLWLYV